MASIDFIYEGKTLRIICNMNEKMSKIKEKFAIKALVEKEAVYFLYNGNKIDEKKTLEEVIGDKEEKKILVYKVDEIEKNKVEIKSKNIICPECGEDIRIKIEEYKIRLYGCKNGHEIRDILIEDYEDIKKVDLTKIKCNKCGKNKSETHENIFYICNACKIKLCPLCKSNHEKEKHIIINYEDKNYICEKHNEQYIKYCRQCQKNICMLCKNEHKRHDQIEYDIPDMEVIKEQIKQIDIEIELLINFINNIVRKLIKVKENMTIYSKINHDIINNYDISKRNYQILQNINELKNNNIMNKIKEINTDKNISNKINKILEIHKNMIKTEIKIRYKIFDKNKKEGKIKIFGRLFVENNKKVK